jgi:transposase InsO family protein
LNQKFKVDAPDHTWVGDITYIPTNEGWLYLAVLLDLFNREVVGWSTSSRLTRQLAIEALQMALGRRSPGSKESTGRAGGFEGPANPKGGRPHRGLYQSKPICSA